MNFFECVSSAISSVLANKMRSILTMLGIIIGISAVIMITAIGIGFQASVKGDFEKFGMDGLQVSMKNDEELKDSDLLRLEDREILKSHPNVSFVAPSYEMMGKVNLKNPLETERVYFIGTNEDYSHVQNIKLKDGRFFNENDIQNASRVVIISENLAKEIFGTTKAIGRTVTGEFKFGMAELTVIGIVESEELGVIFQMPPFAYTPITTLHDLAGEKKLSLFYVMTKDKEKMEETAIEISKILSANRGNEDKYNVQKIMQGVDTFYTVLDGITAFVGLVAAISLVVGGIGVMNIMLVTVTERTREIGIRKSIGATSSNISMQFLIEAMILTVIGGVIGILLGFAGAFAIGAIIKVTPSISVPIVIGTVVTSCLIGVTFGVYPAQKAAKLDPIEALRYE